MSTVTEGSVFLPEWTDCKFSDFLFHFFAHYSSAILFVMSIEKFIVLYFPFKAKTICTLRNAKIVSLITAVVFILFDAQFFYLSKLKLGNGKKVCVFVDKKYGLVIGKIKLVVYTFGPFIIMTLTTVAIALKFFMIKRRSSNGSECTSHVVNKSATRGTATLLLLSFSFIVLTAPASIYSQVVQQSRFDHLFHGCLVILQFLNHSVNAFLYCIVGSRFRTELIKMMKCS